MMNPGIIQCSECKRKTEERHRKILALVRKGLNFAEVAKLVGVSRQAVRYVVLRPP